MTLLRVAIDDVHRVLLQALGIVPTCSWQIDRAGNVGLGEIFRFANIHDNDVFMTFDRMAQLHRSGGERNFLFEKCPRAGRILVLRYNLHLLSFRFGPPKFSAKPKPGNPGIVFKRQL